ncbi:Mus7/MMS22 family-domain-containing protein [Morchella snyderi]|nr:Mus7/MMS22 family-domain-containing protein [Morchella snyderi]
MSSKARPPDSDVFSVWHSDPNTSGDEPVILASIPTKRSTRGRSTPTNDGIDFDDVVEDDRIDRMLPRIPRRGTGQSKGGKHQMRSNGSHKTNGMNHSRGTISASKLGNSIRLRQPKITGHISLRNGRSTRSKRPAAPKLGILDAAQYYRATTSTTPPLFIKIAERGVRKRMDQGRQSPSRKLFFLETERDTRDIQSVLRDWREGTLDCVAQANSYNYQGRNSENQTPSHQLRLASPQDLGEVRVHSPEGLPKPPRTFKLPQPRRNGGRQSTLLNVIRRGPVSRRLVSTRPRPKSHVNPITSVAGQSVFTTHAPRFTPQAAQFETEKPMNHTLRRLHQAPRRAATPNLTLLLQNLAQRNSQLTDGNYSFDSRPHKTPATRDDSINSPSETITPPRPIPRTRRKRIPKRVDVDVIERRQPPPQDITLEDAEYYTPDELPTTSKPVLQGLLKYGNKYSLSFDTMPLKPGTFFNSHTFIGDGGLSRALNTTPIKKGRSNSGISFTFGDKILHWGLYQDSVGAEFEIIMKQIADSAEKVQGANDLDRAEINFLATQVYSFSQFFSNYLASFINFSDSIDLISFGQRILQALDNCCDRVLTTFGGSPYSSSKNASTRLIVHLLAFDLVFKFQIYQLASADEEARTRLEIEKLMRKSGQYLLGQLLKCGLDDVRACYEDQRQINKFERGIDQGHYLVEAWVISIQILNQARSLDTGFWQLFDHESRLNEIKKSLDIRSFENIWRIIFTSLPLHQFDHLGYVHQPPNGSPLENWSLIKTLVTRALEIYQENPEGHSGTIIDYCRILYSRCYHLISSWGWANPDLIIPTLYQFFASSQLANLKNEEGYESVGFLQELQKVPSLAIQNSDRCFHLLLKTIALGINTMKTTSNSEFTIKKITNMVNRLMPNHRRQYPKEEKLRIEHLNALRNHHDLLATLYWAAPPVCRPPLDAIIYLVDPETDHLRACDVSIRTWSNLLRFKLHSGEEINGLEPFVKWFDEIVNKILNQHTAARSEAEKIFKASKEKGNGISEDLLEVNIRRNQKQLEDLLVDAFMRLNKALSEIAGNVESAVRVLSKVSISSILHSHNRLSHKLVIEVLLVVQQYVSSCKRNDDLPPSTSHVDDDSQDYGDWSGFADLVVQDAEKGAGKHISDTIYDSLRQMLSNCFGADKQPEEILLIKVIDTWVLVIGFLVQTGLKEWGVYLNTYSHESWAHLRDTEQTRKFTAYFMTKVIQAGPDTYEQNREAFISFWFKTLVERESMLKFQNTYTTTLLNCDPRNPIFENLPFVRDESSKPFSISQSDFRFRRLSLISTVLANMRKSYEVTRDESPVKGDSIKQEYSRMLQSMMKSMKDNYQELQTKATSGAYVEFVQTVIGYLQQHTIDLVGIDVFFVNPEFFPLPTTDPTYVVGKLKNYGLKLHNQRGQKQLTSFIQSVFERAAVDGEQKYLVGQLTAALSGDFENGDQSKPTLRAFFIGVIFPAYMECIFCEPCGWILAIPVLMALEKNISMMREDIDSTFYPCIISVLSMLTSLLEGMRLGVGFLQPSEVLSPSVLGPLTIMFNCLGGIIKLLDWLSAPENDSIKNLSEVAYDCASFLIKYSGYVRDLIENRETQIPIDVRVNQTFEGRYQAAHKEYVSLLKNSFSKEWYSYGESWFVVRGAKRSEVIPPVIYGKRAGIEVQKREFARTVENLVKVACRTEMFEEVGFSVDPSIWEYEGRGAPHSDGVRGRNRARALRALGNLFF